ncbi:MAG TPA: RNA polymerase sigma factor [Pyrinomonadaceae bacterium]|jgi:RNA polymerase sigma factor (sigma-70 family)
MLEPSEIPRAEATHEELFLARYGSLRSWALRLTAGDAARAEDLVHDAFVHFTLARPDLARMQNLDGYLYQMLRNLNTSQLRRAARRREDAPAVVEFDSVEFALRAADPRDLIRVQDELRQVCRYACLRKETSKAGGVLILRFMHGYYPGEIARFTRSTREAVEERLRVARSEARQYLKDPDSLRFINRERARGGAAEPATGYAQTPEELLLDLRRRVFDSRRGACPDGARLARLYDATTGAAPDCQTLAHLLSCPVCVEEVNRLLNLPPLSERYPTDALGNEPRGKGGGGGDGTGGDGDGGGTGGEGGAGGATREEAGRCRRRAREVFEHRPRELCVSVNGRVLGAQRVGSVVNEQKLNVSGGEGVSFVEVFSEQGVRLLYLDAALWPADADGGRTARVSFSDRRTLEARLTHVGSAPTLRVVYRDPLMAAAPAARSGLAEGDGAIGGALEDEGGAEEDEGRAGRARARRAPFAPALDWLRRLTGRFTTPFKVIRPVPVAAALAVIVAAALLFTRFSVPPVSAAELLRRAAAAEESAAAAGLVLHRTVYVEEARADGRGRVTRRRVETWQGGASGIRLRRLYDEQGRLSAGEWTNSDGATVVYRRGSAPTSTGAAGAAGVAQLIEAGELWRVEPSAGTFGALAGADGELKVEERLGAYVLAVPARGGAAAGVLRGAELWLNKSDLRAFRMTLAVERGGERFEHRFIEGAFEKRRPAEVPPSVYQVEPELLGAAEGAGGAGAAVRTQSAEGGRAPAGGARAPAVASAELEVEVAYLLNQIKANLGEQVSMGRTTGGALRVEALVESEGRKEAILRALGPVAGDPAVVIAVSTVAEELARRERERAGARAGGATEREVVVAGAGRIPADAELRAHFGARLADGARVDAEIKGFAARAMRHSRQALLHASALRRLAGRFTPEQARELQPEARAKWLSMIKEHAGAYRREVAALRAQLTPVFGPQGAGARVAPAGAPAESAERLLQSSYAQDDAVRSAFTVSEGGGSAAALKSPQFWRALAEGERLAAYVAEAYER